MPANIVFFLNRGSFLSNVSYGALPVTLL